MKIKNYIFLTPLIFYYVILQRTLFFKSNDDASKDCIDESKINDQIACIEIYDPVCGCNDITYSNSCYAEREGLTDWLRGSCD